MEITFTNVFIVIGLIMGFFFLQHIVVRARRHAAIKNYNFPRTISVKVQEKYPHLKSSQIDQVIHCLREYFYISNLAGHRMVSMPSQVVDVAWHEFILFTKEYKRFCKTTMGRFLHHTQAEAMKSPTQAQEGIKRAWRLACIREKIHPHKATRMPLLFAIDSLLNIPDGFKYTLDCKKSGGDFCAGHIGCGSGCAGGCGGSSDSSCGGGCGGD